MKKTVALINIFCYFGIVYLLQYAILRTIDADTIAMDDYFNVILIQYAILVIALIALNYSFLCVQIKNFWDKKSHLFKALLIVFIIYMSSVIIGLLEVIFEMVDIVPENQQRLLNLYEITSMGGFILFTAVFNPFVEEIVFRASILAIVNPKNIFLKILTALFTAFLFAIVHEVRIFGEFNLENLMNFLKYFIPGVIFVICYMRTKNIFTVILAHMILDIVALMGIYGIYG